jgi:acyl-CoA thioesterase-1
MPYLRLGILIGLLLPLCAQAREPTKVLILGDSISAAYGMNIEQGWVHLWAQSLQDRAHVINASISGETTTGGLARLPALLNEHEPELVVIELGGHDGLRGYPLGQLKQNLTQLVRFSQAAGARVALVPMQIPPNYGDAYTRRFFETFAQVAAAREATLTPFILEDVALKSELMQSDGIHPTAAAQPMLLAKIVATLNSLLLEISTSTP